MLISTTTTVAVRCSICGNIELFELSLFSFAGSKKVCLNCTCGSELIHINTKDRKTFWLRLECTMCEEIHYYPFTLREIWSNEIIIFSCEETGLEIGYMGPRALVEEEINKQNLSLREMADDLGFIDYFENPEIMYGILNFLHQMAEKEKVSCQCGNNYIEVEIFPDRIDLKCPDCGAVGIVYAESEKDLETMRQVQEIQLTNGSLMFFDLCKRDPGRNYFKK